jgi:Ala-tRNA(Pro) deacylase
VDRAAEAAAERKPVLALLAEVESASAAVRESRVPIGEGQTPPVLGLAPADAKAGRSGTGHGPGGAVMSLVTDYLTERGVELEVVPHRRAFTSLQEARAVGVAADEVVKTVALWTGGKYALAVVPASRRLDLRLVREALEDPAARLATEAELVADFPGYELGALPPLGSLLGVPLLVDPAVLDHEVVVFAAGTEVESVQAVTAALFRDEPVAVLPLTRRKDRAREEPVT